jgi:flagellar protein FlaG
MNISSISNLSSHVSAAAQTAAVKPPSTEQKALIQAVKTVNASGSLEENELTFVVDRAANIAVVRIVNKKTGELVDQIPNEQVLKMAEKSSGR